MNGSKIIGIAAWRHAAKIAVVVAITGLVELAEVRAQDVMLQTSGGKIVTGSVDHTTAVATLGTRVFRGNFLSNYRSSDPGFYAFATGNVNLPAGAQGFPSNHDLYYDFVPMRWENAISNLMYWDGLDSNSDGLDLNDVNFSAATNVQWQVFDAGFVPYGVDGSESAVSGGLIDRTSADINPGDGVDTGSLHRHLLLQLSDLDDNPSTLPAAGVYMIALQARAAGYETSDPFLFVLRTSTLTNAARDLAVEWAQQNLETLVGQLGVAGDYNQDGYVDAADYVIWRKTVGTDAPMADGDGSGLVDEPDYQLWRQAFGTATAGQGGGSTAVPEPRGAWLVIGAVLSTFFVKRR